MDNLRRVDLQLLVALDVLLEDPHVTRAARKLQLSQPAMSHALARLRTAFRDPLFVRTAKGLTPTERALALKYPVKNVLQQVERIVSAHPIFDPATSGDTFVIRMGDMNELLILPAITAALEQEAPGTSLTVKHVPPLETIRGLEADEISVAISAELEHPKLIRSITLMGDEMVCIMRKDHPAARHPLTLKEYQNLRHIRIAQTTADMRVIDGYLSRHAPHSFRVTIPHWLAVPSLVESSDLVAAISRRMANRINTHGRLAIRSLPMSPRAFEWRLYWHSRHDLQPAHKWLRELITRACMSLR